MKKRNFFIFVILSFLFVLFSFSPTIFEILERGKLHESREFTLDHNYVFDFNFYISRIREGYENRFLVSEKYFNEPHPSSLFQILYLALGKAGSILNIDPVVVYHSSRLIFGMSLLLFISFIITKKIKGIFYQIVTFLLVVTEGSLPIFVKVGSGINFFGYRSATYMGWWSSQDSLSRITYIPHVLVGQIGLLLFIFFFSGKCNDYKKILAVSILGFLIGIIFPPTLIILFAWFVFQTFFEFIFGKMWQKEKIKEFILKTVCPRAVFMVISGLSLVYMQLMFKIVPWSTLATFDIRHRMPLPFGEYLLSLGIVFFIGMGGLGAALIRKDKNMTPFISWVFSVFFLIFLFWDIPTQSPLRFTQAAMNIPTGILAGYLFYVLMKWFSNGLGKIGIIILGSLFSGVILMGLVVMVSMVGWLTDQVIAKREGTFLYPTGAQLIYPLKTFMEGIYYLRDTTNQKTVVLAAETAGNFIPAYAGNYVYYGHANTPDDEIKKSEINNFLKGITAPEKAHDFLKRENISYIYFGPQEKEISGNFDMSTLFFLKEIYRNKDVVIYKVL